MAGFASALVSSWFVAEVYLNGEKMGEHRGGFAAFCYELTGKLKVGEANELRVRVDNARNPDVAPLSADFTMEGGIYRPVQLIVTAKTCSTPGGWWAATNASPSPSTARVPTRPSTRKVP